ncbi:MAG: Response regulator receiver [Candidatus Daviesbacteria bacterium GW2011_GWA1_38_7]|nr:MAG: Response regulator receiver [Candidatus Daviesbacteria bacterium GW2011_GWA1_38_7]
MTKQKRILVVDDDLSILEVIKIILEEENYHVTTASKINTIDSLFRDNIPDLILLDIWMTGIDGREIARRLKSHAKYKNIPIVVISAHNDTPKMAKEAGADGFLPKPFDIPNLVATVKKHTEKDS